MFDLNQISPVLRYDADGKAIYAFAAEFDYGSAQPARLEFSIEPLWHQSIDDTALAELEKLLAYLKRVAGD